jgi:hypothetical protein
VLCCRLDKNVALVYTDSITLVQVQDWEAVIRLRKAAALGALCCQGDVQGSGLVVVEKKLR